VYYIYAMCLVLGVSGDDRTSGMQPCHFPVPDVTYNVFVGTQNVPECVCRRGCAPDPTGGTYINSKQCRAGS